MNSFSVLIIEDDLKISKIHKLFVQKVKNFDVVGIANSLDDAQKMVDILEPDLILLDLYFPEGNGIDFLRELRNNENSSDVILITAANEIKTVQKALHSGVFDYIVKPVIFDRFQESLINYKNYKMKLLTNSKLDQSEIDSYFHKKHNETLSVSNELPKGIDFLTLNKIKKIFDIIDDSGMSAEEVADKSGVSRSTARRYLEYLVSTGYLNSDQLYGTVGRPERKYFSK